jgi:hypothetical protein
LPISYTQYVSITSGVGANETVKERDLITRIFTANPLLPNQTIVEFNTLTEVGSYFGTASEEYQRAAFYFGYVSKLIGAPDKIGFARVTPAAAAAYLSSDPAAVGTLSQFTSLPSPSTFAFTLGGTALTVTGLNLTTASSLSAVATALQVAIRAQGTGTNFTGATVTYTAASGGTPAFFTLTGGTTGAAGGAIVPDLSGADAISGLLGFQTANTIISPATNAQTVSLAVAASIVASTNFFSYCFVNTLNLQVADYTNLAIQNTTFNVDFLLEVPVTATSASAMSTALAPYEGCAITLCPVLSPLQFPEMFPGMLAAATDYSQPNVAANYMYQPVPGLSPSVQNDTDFNTYNGLNVNFYGLTQVNGQQIAFYQEGFLTGVASAPNDMGVYTNEAWFKGAMSSQFFQMLLALNEVPVNSAGKAIVTGNALTVIAEALINGTISVGKTLSTTQQQYITAATGSPIAWYQVQTIGYWLGVSFSSVVNNRGITIWQVNYTVIYAKNDVVRKVVGTHVLI